MLIPSIDLLGGRVVQLVGGRDLALEAGDPLPLARRFAVAGAIAVVDLDAALGQGDHRSQILPLLELAECRVGGGIRDVASACAWLDAGAAQVVLGTAARPEVLRALPRERVIAALDCRDGEVVVQGWRERTGRNVLDRMAELREHVGGFLVTFVEAEGRMQGLPRGRIPALREAAGPCTLTIAGGVTTPDDIAFLDAHGCDAQVGMALYTGRLDLADALAAPLCSERPDGLWPTLVVDELGVALGLAWSDAESLREAVRTRRGVYRSRTRGLWRKGATSGAHQELLCVSLDCDRDALRFTVRQHGPGFCHRATRTCFGDDPGPGALARRLGQRIAAAPAGSYTARLAADPALLSAKLVEEAAELATATTPAHVRHEAADLLYFALVACARSGVDLADVTRELELRHRRVTRRPGHAKPARDP